MANLSDLTRKEQVLARLQQANGGWVDGPDIANEEVGGSEGLRRLRELADDGWDVRKRQHPDPARDIWQYRLAGKKPITESYVPLPTKIEPAEKPEYPRPAPQAPQTRIATAVVRKEDGTYEYVPPRQAFEQLTTPPDPPQPAGRSFDRRPRNISYGDVAICPRCHSKTTRGKPPKEKDAKEILTVKQRRDRERHQKEAPGLVDNEGVLLFKDPTRRGPCERCNGYGIVPNVGPIP